MSALNRHLYRSLLRATSNGKRPECILWPYFRAAEQSAPLPRTARCVRRLLRKSFDSVAAPPIDAFDVLRHANQLSHALRPMPMPPTGSSSSSSSSNSSSSSSSSDSLLPAFCFRSHALLPGERAEFVFFEPRYVALAEEALASEGKHYLHVPRDTLARGEEATATVCTIVEHARLPDGRIAVEVVAGGRARALCQEEVAVAEGAPPLPRCAAEPFGDGDVAAVPAAAAAGGGSSSPGDGGDDDEAAASLRLTAMQRECFGLLDRLITPASSVCARSGLPPLCPELFSLWSCHLLLHQGDTPSRVGWLECDSTAKRMHFVHEMLRALVDAREREEQQGDEEE